MSVGLRLSPVLLVLLMMPVVLLFVLELEFELELEEGVCMDAGRNKSAGKMIQQGQDDDDRAAD